MGNLTKTSSNLQYTKYDYASSGSTYRGIHVFETKSKAAQSIAPAISVSKAELSQINPISVSANNVIAKTNANMHDYNKNNFYGFFYQGTGKVAYVDGMAYSDVAAIPSASPMFTDASPKYWPSFCVKTDGTAAIRWFGSKSALTAAIPHCKCIIASVHALVFNGKCVFNEEVYDAEPSGESKLIMSPTGSNAGANVRYNQNNGRPNSNEYRTLLGHKAGLAGIYLLVSTDAGMTCKAAANLMLDLGCDYAVNMDGSSPVQMRIKDGYGANGRVTANAGVMLHTAVCAHEI